MTWYNPVSLYGGLRNDLFDTSMHLNMIALLILACAFLWTTTLIRILRVHIHNHRYRLDFRNIAKETTKQCATNAQLWILLLLLLFVIRKGWIKVAVHFFILHATVATLSAIFCYTEIALYVCSHDKSSVAERGARRRAREATIKATQSSEEEDAGRTIGAAGL